MTDGYTNIFWMRDGIKAWKEAGYPVVTNQELLDALITINNEDTKASIINETEARKLSKCTFVDFRSKPAFDSGHIDGATHVDYPDMFTKPMMEFLNKSNNLVIIHDTPQIAGTIATTLKLMDYPSVHILQ